MKPNNVIKKYAINTVTYVLNKLNQKSFNDIKQIILFGSAARGTATKESDIDLFFETNKKNKNIIKKKINEFYTSREGLLFKTKGISNQFQITVGKIEEWKELHKSIASEGIILYGPYLGKAPKGLKHYFIISWENLDIKNRGAFLNKLYGYSVGETKYKGLVKKWDAKKIGKSAILLPSKYKLDLFNILDKYKVDFKIIDVYI